MESFRDQELPNSPEWLGSINFEEFFATIKDGDVLLPDMETASERTEPPELNPHSPKDGENSTKSTTQTKGKRKVKVKWTPELHRRFVQAVEQLGGVDKAVPTKILELMGVDAVNRNNIASHLQKYRSRQKHLLEREAEAASLSQSRQMYGAAAPTIGFPAPPPMHHQYPFRPLHVLGYPCMAPPPAWRHHLNGATTSMAPPPAWHPPPPPDPSFWRFDIHPSEESVKATIDAGLSKPRLPRMGLKLPSDDAWCVLGDKHS